MGLTIAIALLAQATPATDPCPKGDDACFRELFRSWQRLDQNKQERLGPGPHLLIVSHGKDSTRIRYKTGKACQAARDIVRKQNAPRKEEGGIMVYPGTNAFCIPQ